VILSGSGPALQRFVAIFVQKLPFAVQTQPVQRGQWREWREVEKGGEGDRNWGTESPSPRDSEDRAVVVCGCDRCSDVAGLLYFVVVVVVGGGGGVCVHVSCCIVMLFAVLYVGVVPTWFSSC